MSRYSDYRRYELYVPASGYAAAGAIFIGNLRKKFQEVENCNFDETKQVQNMTSIIEK